MTVSYEGDPATPDEIEEVMQRAKRTYEAYGRRTNFKNFRGDPMPEWDALGHTIQDAWKAATMSAFDEGYERALRASANS